MLLVRRCLFCAAVVATTRRLATEYVDPDGISALVPGRLIPLDKNLGVRPIGIGEVLRCFIAKAILAVIKQNIRESAGALQVCAGHEAGAEAAIRAMADLYSNVVAMCMVCVLTDAWPAPMGSSTTDRISTTVAH